MQTRSSSRSRPRRHGWQTIVAGLLVALAPGLLAPTCSDSPPPPPPETERWEVRLSPEAPRALRWTADDLVRYLSGMGLEVELVETLDEPECGPGRSAVVLVGDGLSEAALETEAPTDQTFRIEERRCDGGRTIELSGGGLLGRQYAAYEWLHQLGVRFFHPEEEFVPDEPGWSSEPLVLERTPPFRFRSVSLHLTHPLELGDAFELGEEEHLDEAVRYIDWTVKNLASDGRAGVGNGADAEHGLERGFPRSAGFSLYGIQQGGNPIIDPDDPRSDEEQIAAAIEERMGADPARRPQMFSFTFNPTEFTEAADTDVLRQLTFIADYFAEHYPDTILMTINHGTGAEPTPTYGVRYFDLPGLAPPNLGVKVHSLMFYDLFRPAPVYGNEDFGFLYDFMVDQYQTRRLWHFPEAAWWLTFDIAVPLYLPLTIEARDRDLQGIAFMLEGGLDGHHVFGTGHEWGYWQNEYCSFRMAADLEYRWQDCVADLASPMGPAAGEVARVIEDLVEQQERDLIYGGVLPYLVGTDAETEAAWDLGIEFHPLPPSPQAILGWDLDQVTAWQETTLSEIRSTDEDCATLVARLDAVEAEVPERARSFFDEIRDGIEATGLRARHGWQVYGALVLLRESRLRADAELETEAARWLDDARATTEAALAVIHRREAGYRYSPLERSIAGGPDGTEDSNWTIYGYRYLNRTHHGTYYTRIDELAEDAFAGSDELAALDDALLGPGEALALRVVDAALDDVTVTFGDGGSAEGGPLFEHEYAEPNAYRVELAATRADEPLSWQADVASLEQELTTGFTGRIVEPMGAVIIESVLPALVFGPAGDAGLAIGFGTDESGAIRRELWTAVPRAAGGEAFLESAPADLTVPIVTRSTGAVMASIVVESAVLAVADPAGPATLSGRLATQAVIDAVVAVGGFDEEGARDLVATMLGFTAETLPADVAFAVEYSL